MTDVGAALSTQSPAQEGPLRSPPLDGGGRLDTLTGLRFGAALLIFLLHLGTYVPKNRFGAAYNHVFGQGTVGVSFFFILSGFVLTWSHRDGDTAARFYRRRFARIAPAYWAALVLALADHLATPPISGRAPLLWQALPSLVGIQAWFPSEAYHYGGNSVEWSVSAELFFYAAFPLLIGVCLRRSARTALWPVALVGVVLLPVLLRPSSEVGDWAIYILPLQRMAEFLCGMLLAAALRSSGRLRIGFPLAAVLAVGTYAALGLVPSWARPAILTLVPFLLLIGSAAEADLAGRRTLANGRVMRKLGEWSYSFYLVHLVVLTATFYVANRLMSPGRAFALGAPSALVASLIASACLYYAVERPLERRLRHARPRPEMAAA